MPDQQTARTPPKAPAVIALAVLVAAPLAASFEGYAPKVYKDPAAIPTYCYGETQNVDPARIYTQTECATLLRARMARDYAPHLLQCVPVFANPLFKFNFGALLDASYNAGWVAACRSPMAAAFNARRFVDGCNAFPGWYTTARNRKTGVRVQFAGLVRRREAERRVCMGNPS